LTIRRRRRTALKIQRLTGGALLRVPKPLQPRINNRTLWLTTREQIRADQFRVGLHLSEHSRQGADQLGFGREVTIVGPGLPRVLPEPLRGIELRRAGWRLMYVPPVAIRGEPAPHLGILVIGGVVLNQHRSAPAAAPRQLFQKGQAGRGVEDGVQPLVETGAPQLDGAQDLHAFAFSRHRSFGRTTDAAPGGMQRGILPEAGFVGENQRPAFVLRFFLRFG